MIIREVVRMGGDTQHIRERGMHTRDKCRGRE